MNKFSKHKGQQFLFLIFIIIWFVFSANVNYVSVWIAENILLFLAVIYLVETYKEFAFSNLSYILIFIFAIMQTAGSHYSYAEVPLGNYIMEWLDFERNHYDRLVHFSFGLLLLIPFREKLNSLVSFTSHKLEIIIILTFFVGMGGAYEILEWLYALAYESDKDVLSVLGSQGDIWDAQKDMFLNFLGALIALTFTSKLVKKL